MGKILKQGQVVDHGRLRVVGQLESTGQFSEIYKVKKVHGPGERLLKINLPHKLLDKDATAECVYDFSKQNNHNQRTEHEAFMLSIANPQHVAPLDELVKVNSDYLGLLFFPLNDARTLKNEISKFKTEYIQVNTATKLLQRLDKITTGIIDAVISLSPNFGIRPPEVPTTPSIIHRDIKPDNILLGENDRVYLIDFGVSCFNTEKETFFGSRSYSSAKKDNTEYRDYWSAGMCVYESFARRHLLDNSSNVKIKRKNIQLALNDLLGGPSKINDYLVFLKEQLQMTERRWLRLTPYWTCLAGGKNEKAYRKTLESLLDKIAFLCLPHNLLLHNLRSAQASYCHSLPLYNIMSNNLQKPNYKKIISDAKNSL